ncbi:MAG: hypothetical protein KA586_06500 [Candidatus Promineofilum sp.]|nr:hypothetical protein [Promineifilum sp.]
MKRYATVLFVLAGILLIVACGGGEGATPQPTGVEDEIAGSVQQTVAAIAVAKTVAALTGGTATAPADLPAVPTPVITPSDAPPATAAAPDADTPPPATAPPAASATAAPSCTVVSGVNLRGGPGTIYDPPVGFAAANTALRPLAYTPFGNPQGAWLLVEVAGSGQQAWLSAGAQFVRCSVDPATLPPPANVPATPRPANTATPTATAQPVAALPPDLRNVSGGAGCLDDPDIQSNFQTDSRFLLRIYAQLFSPPPDESGDGAGIERVEFFVRESGYSHTERTAGYCIFQGGEPTCRDWPRDQLGRLTWGDGGPVVVDGNYNIDVNVFPKEDTLISQCNWTISLTVDVP